MIKHIYLLVLCILIVGYTAEVKGGRKNSFQDQEFYIDEDVEQSDRSIAGSGDHEGDSTLIDIEDGDDQETWLEGSAYTPQESQLPFGTSDDDDLRLDGSGDDEIEFSGEEPPFTLDPNLVIWEDKTEAPEIKTTEKKEAVSETVLPPPKKEKPVHADNVIPDLPANEGDDKFGDDISNEIDNVSGDTDEQTLHREPEKTSLLDPAILAAVIGGTVVGLLCAVLLVMFIVYRMRKKDEGSYALDEPKRSPHITQYNKNPPKEFYA